MLPAEGEAGEKGEAVVEEQDPEQGRLQTESTSGRECAQCPPECRSAPQSPECSRICHKLKTLTMALHSQPDSSQTVLAIDIAPPLMDGPRGIQLPRGHPRALASGRGSRH